MKRFTCLLALILAIGLTFSTNDAEARRLGGGMSSGMQRGSGIMQRSAAPTPAPGQNLSQAARPAPGAAPGAAPAPAGMSRWLGPLAGIAAGVGIASLFSHFGMGGGMGSMLMMLLVGGGIFLVVRMLMQRGAQSQPQPQYAGSNGGPARFEPYVVPQNGAAPPAAAASTGSINVPAGFDVDGFLRQAKLNFVRLQAANDAGNMEDIRAFTSPEMFAEVRLEYQERGRINQQTDVVQLNAALLDLSTESARQIASVRFYGSLRENAAAAPEDFDEVWHLSRPADASSGWIIAGIQQFN